MIKTADLNKGCLLRAARRAVMRKRAEIVIIGLF